MKEFTPATVPSVEDELLSKGYLKVAEVSGTHGLEGLLRLVTADASPDWLNQGSTLTVIPKNLSLAKAKGDSFPLELEDATLLKAHKAIVRLAEVNTPEAAGLWLGSSIYIDKAKLPPLEDEDTYRSVDLVGLSVHLDDDAEHACGVVSAIISDKSNSDGDTFIELTLNKTHKALMIPFNAHFIKPVDIETGRLVLSNLGNFIREQNTPAEPKQKRLTPYQRRKLKRQKMNESSTET